MKITVILLILTVLLINPASATTIEEELYERDSIEIAGHNITLVGIGNKERSIVACINNEIHIIDKEEKREIENIKVRPNKIYEDYVKLSITYSEERDCDESCSNSLCSGINSQEQTEENQENVQKEENNSIQENQERKSNIDLFSAGLFLLVLMLLIVLLIKKK